MKQEMHSQIRTIKNIGETRLAQIMDIISENPDEKMTMTKG